MKMNQIIYFKRNKWMIFVVFDDFEKIYLKFIIFINEIEIIKIIKKFYIN